MARWRGRSRATAWISWVEEFGTGVALHSCMPPVKPLLSMQIMRPATFRVGLFLAACGLSSAIGAVATVLRLGPLGGVRQLESEQIGVSRSSPPMSAEPVMCPESSTNMAIERATLLKWVGATISNEGGRVHFQEGRYDELPPSLQILLAEGSWHQGVGLSSLDKILYVQNVLLDSRERVEELSRKLLREEPETVSVSLIREGCPISLNWWIR